MYYLVMKSRSRWTLLTNHAVVLLCVAAEPEITVRDMADRVGITERAVHRIVSDLVNDGYVKIEKSGRRNHYVIQGGHRLREAVAGHVRLREVLGVLAPVR